MQLLLAAYGNTTAKEAWHSNEELTVPFTMTLLLRAARTMGLRVQGLWV